MTDNTSPQKFLATATSIINQFGLQIDALEPMPDYSENDRPEGMHRFVGHFVAPIQTPQGVINHPIQFPIEADSIEQAFENFETALKAHIDEQRSKSKITAPSAAEISQIIRP